MSEPFLGEIKIMAFGFAPKGWALCNGQLLPINQNQALFSILGTTYGGDGRVNFGLPDLRGRVPVYQGGGIVLGQRAGEETHTLILSELPAHSHGITATTAVSNNTNPVGHLWAQGQSPIYGTPGTPIAMNTTLVSNVGGNQPHTNMMPYLVLNFCIALQGIFPSMT